jgi:hypothetical protein
MILLVHHWLVLLLLLLQLMLLDVLFRCIQSLLDLSAGRQADRSKGQRTAAAAAAAVVVAIPQQTIQNSASTCVCLAASRPLNNEANGPPPAGPPNSWRSNPSDTVTLSHSSHHHRKQWQPGGLGFILGFIHHHLQSLHPSQSRHITNFILVSRGPRQAFSTGHPVPVTFVTNTHQCGQREPRLSNCVHKLLQQLAFVKAHH